MRILLLVSIFFISLLANEKVSLQLQWYDQFQFAGYYIAKEKGFYKDVGLDVEIKKYRPDIDIVKDVKEGKTTFGIGRTSLLIDESQGAKIVLMSAIFQTSPLVLVTKKSTHTDTIEEFKNKRAMLTGTKTSAGIFAMLASQGISRDDMIILKSKNKLLNLINGKVDIISAYTSNQVHILREKGVEINVFNPKDFGFDFYSDILFTSQKEYQNHPRTVIKFDEATLKGWKYAFSHIGETVKLILKKYNSQNKSDADLFFEAMKLKELAYKKGVELGDLDENKLQQIYNIYRIMGYIKKAIDLKSMILDKNLERLHFTKKEKKWIKEHPVITYSEINWKPLSIIRGGKMVGVFGDFLDLVSKKSGLNFKFIPSATWGEVIEKFKTKKIDMLPSSPQNLNLGLVSDVYKTYPMVIVAGDGYRYISDLENLIGKRVAVPKNYTSYNYLVKNYPDIKLMITKDIPHALMLVEDGKADAFVGHMATSIYYISSLQLNNLKIAGTTNFEFKHQYLVQKEYPELISILNKTIKLITPEERAKIYSKYSSAAVQKVDYKLFVKVLILVVIIYLFLLYRNRQLKHHNTEISKLKERLELALIGNNDGVWDRDLVNDTLYISPRWKEILGYRDDEIKNEVIEWEKRVHPDDLEKALSKAQEHLEGKTEFYESIHRLKHKDGSWVWVLDRGKRIVDKNGKPIRMLGTHTDITKEKEMQIEHRHQQQIIEQIHDCVISTDTDGVIKSWNRGAETLLEYSKDEIIGEHISILYDKKGNFTVERFLEMLLKNDKLNIELKLKKKSGKIIYTESSISIFKDENGKVVGIIGYIKDISRRKEAEKKIKQQEEKLRYQANYDILTGLPNRALFQDRLKQNIEKAKRHKSKFALFFLDLDRFKQINDSLGHEIGDIVLKKASSRIKSVLRKEDTLARLGGDEFVIITGDIDKIEDAGVLASKIIISLQEPIDVLNHKLYVTVSIGISLYPDDGVDSKNLLKYADSAMYKAKDEGKNNYQFYSPEMTKMAIEKIALETDLRLAIKNRDFIVYYQPQIDSSNDKLVGMEALVRWQTSDGNLVSPASFIPLAEETGMIADIDLIVMQKAMGQVEKWRKEGLEPGVLALNLSMDLLNNSQLLKIIKQNISKYNLDVANLELEVTEGKIMKNPQSMILKLKKLNEMGIKIAIDDFGTGYSSLSYLKKLPIDRIKIDQSFISHIPQSEDDTAIVRAIIALSKSLNLELIAEGVELEKQKNFLVENGCKDIQGYYYSKPLPSEKMEKLFLSKK